MLALCSNSKKIHWVSRNTLEGSSYFSALLSGKWSQTTTALDGAEVCIVDCDDDSLAVLLTLLRYGAGGLPPLEAHQKTKLAKDADYYGLDLKLWSELVEAAPIEPKTAHPCDSDELRQWDAAEHRNMRQCRRCNCFTATAIRQCSTCRGAVSSHTLTRISVNPTLNSGVRVVACHTCKAPAYSIVRWYCLQCYFEE
jgi:hypothetical protein